MKVTMADAWSSQSVAIKPLPARSDVLRSPAAEELADWVYPDFSYPPSNLEVRDYVKSMFNIGHVTRRSRANSEYSSSSHGDTPVTSPRASPNPMTRNGSSKDSSPTRSTASLTSLARKVGDVDNRPNGTLQRDLSVEEELQLKLYEVRDVAKGWHVKWKQEHLNKLRLVEHLQVCEDECLSLFSHVGNIYHAKVTALEDNLCTATLLAEKVMKDRNESERILNEQLVHSRQLVKSLDSQLKQVNRKLTERTKQCQELVQRLKGLEGIVNVKSENSKLHFENAKLEKALNNATNRATQAEGANEHYQLLLDMSLERMRTLEAHCEDKLIKERRRTRGPSLAGEFVGQSRKRGSLTLSNASSADSCLPKERYFDQESVTSVVTVLENEEDDSEDNDEQEVFETLPPISNQDQTCSNVRQIVHRHTASDSVLVSNRVSCPADIGTTQSTIAETEVESSQRSGTDMESQDSVDQIVPAITKVNGTVSNGRAVAPHSQEDINVINRPSGLLRNPGHTPNKAKPLRRSRTFDIGQQADLSIKRHTFCASGEEQLSIANSLATLISSNGKSEQSTISSSDGNLSSSPKPGQGTSSNFGALRARRGGIIEMSDKETSHLELLNKGKKKTIDIGNLLKKFSNSDEKEPAPEPKLPKRRWRSLKDRGKLTTASEEPE